MREAFACRHQQKVAKIVQTAEPFFRIKLRPLFRVAVVLGVIVALASGSVPSASCVYSDTRVILKTADRLPSYSLKETQS